MTTRLLLVCHASTPAFSRDAFPEEAEGLDGRGFAQVPPFTAQGTARRGPEARCRLTAEAFGLAAAPDDALRDCDYGNWRGRTLQEVRAAEPEAVAAWRSDPEAAPHGGESVTALLKRVRDWLDGLSEGPQVAVTHPAVIRAAVLHAVRGGPELFWQITVEPLGRASLTRRDGHWGLRFPSDC